MRGGTVLEVLPQLVGNRGLAGLKLAIAEPDRFAIEPKVDGVRGLLAFLPDGTMETRNRRGIRRDWLRGDGFETGLRGLAQRLPILCNGTVLDGELIASRFAGTMADSTAHDASAINFGSWCSMCRTWPATICAPWLGRSAGISLSS
jgi:hypothetical protein